MISDLDYRIPLFCLFAYFIQKNAAKQETVKSVIISFSLLKVAFFIQNAGNDKCINGMTYAAVNGNSRNFAHPRNVRVVI